MNLLEVTLEGVSRKIPMAVNPLAIRSIKPAGNGCELEMMAIHESDTDYVATYRIVESYETVMSRLREIGA